MSPQSKSGRPGPGRQRVAWPSIDDQLREAKVVHGSALEQLIRDNQATALLRPDESPQDQIGLPLWLRVYFRKQHPELAPAPAGPAGDYPEALENVYDWMVANQDLPAPTSD
jgi:hypothetical protein